MHPGDGLSDKLAFLELGGLDTVELASLISQEARRLFGGSEVVVWRYREDLGRLFSERRGLEPASIAVTAADIELLERGGIAWQPAAGGVRSRLIEASFGLVAEQRHGTVLGVTLGRDDLLWGLLMIAGDASLAAAVSAESLARFAHQVGVLLVNHAQLQRAESNEAQREALFETAGELSSNLDLETVLTAIVERVQVVARAPISYIMLVDEAAGEIAMRVTLGTEDPGFRRLRLRLGGGLGGRVAAQQRPFYTTGYLEDERIEHDAAVDAAVRSEGVRSILGAPMSVANRFVGVLFVADRAVRVFSEAEVGLVASLANHAATAIRNADLYDRTRSALTDLARSNELVQEQNNRLQRAAALHAQLSGAVLEGKRLPDIVELTAGVSGGQLLAFDRNHQLIARGGEPGDEFGEGLLATGAAAEVAQLPELARLLAGGDGSTVHLEPTGVRRRRSWLVAPIVAGAAPLGSLWLGVPASQVEDARPLFDQATRVVALELLKERAVAEVHRRLGRELLDDLVAGHGRVDDNMARRAAEMGVDLGRPHRLARIALRSRGDRVDLAQASEELVAALRRCSWCRFAAQHSRDVVAVVDSEAAAPADLLRAAVGPVVDSTGVGVKAAISPACTRVEEYRRFFLAAGRVLGLLRAKGSTVILDLGDAWVLALIFGGEDDGSMAAFVDAQLGELILHDEQHGLSLLETLDAYLQADLSATRAAAALEVHVNTVYYRLQRLRELLGESFTEPQRVLDLRVAVLAHQTLAL